MARIAWTLTDLSTETPEVLSFEINPNEFSPPGRQANITSIRTAAPLGTKILFGGGDQVPTGQMSGLVNSETFKDDLTAWSLKWWPLVLTDDLSNSWDILIQEVTWTRVRRAIFPHRYDYTIRFLEVS